MQKRGYVFTSINFITSNCTLFMTGSADKYNFYLQYFVNINLVAHEKNVCIQVSGENLCKIFFPGKQVLVRGQGINISPIKFLWL